MRNGKFGRWNSECGKSEWGKSEGGRRPPASPSCRLYEPEAVGAIGAYAPEGMGNLKHRAKSIAHRVEQRTVLRFRVPEADAGEQMTEARKRRTENR